MKIEIPEEKFQKIRREAEEYYKTIGKIKCPYFANEEISFNREGFEHLLFKSWNTTRTRFEQYTRLRLLPLAAKIIAKSHTLQEFDERNMFIRHKTNSVWSKVMKRVRYYVFVAIISEARLKVVIKEIEGGGKFFYSLYPSWKVVNNEAGQQKKVFYSGDLEEL